MPRTTKLFIPDKIAVGFNERQGTYTGKLAYVIYYDQKGVLRKEKSWQKWRDQKIKPEDFDNQPTEGFVLNKGVGGTRNSWSSWNPRNEYIRVYDPRGFEFEISVPNLLFILKECDCSRGKGLEGEFVYAWDKSELVLLPVSSMDYKMSQEFTEFKEKSIHVKNLVDGATYTTKEMEDIVYVGRFEYYFAVGNRYGHGPRKKDHKGFIRKFVFWDGEKFLFTENVKHLAVCKTEVPPDNYAELVDRFHNSKNGTRVVRLFLKKKPKPKKDDRYANREHWWFEDEDGTFVRAHGRFGRVKTTPKNEPGGWTEKLHHVEMTTKVTIGDDGITREVRCEHASFPNERAFQEATKTWSGGYPYSHSDVWTNYPNLGRWVEPTGMDLWVELESGKKFKYDAISHSVA
jgi:hypothetical protein